MASNRGTQLFVARLPWTVCRDTLREHFQQFGKVTFSLVAFDYNSGRSKRFGFVEFESPESHKRALEQQHIINGAKVFVQSRQSEEKNPRGRRHEDFTEV